MQVRVLMAISQLPPREKLRMMIDAGNFKPNRLSKRRQQPRKPLLISRLPIKRRRPMLTLKLKLLLIRKLLKMPKRLKQRE